MKLSLYFFVFNIIQQFFSLTLKKVGPECGDRDLFVVWTCRFRLVLQN